MAAVALADPAQADAYQKIWDMKSQPVRDADFNSLTQVYSALDNKDSAGNPKPATDLAVKSLMDRATAEQNAKVPGWEQLRDMATQLQNNPSAVNMVKAELLPHLAAYGKGPVAEAYGKALQSQLDVNGGDDDDGSGGTKIARPGDVLLDKHGKVLYSGAGQVSGAGGPAGVAPTALPDIADRIGAIEGTFPNGASSASGYGQFTNGTWLATYKSQYPNSGLSDMQILAKRSDPTVAKQMLGVLTGQNAQALQDAGLAPNAGNVYLAHFLGAPAAVAVLHADPSTPISKLVSPAAIKANPSILGGQTAGQVQAWANQKMTQGAPNSGASADLGGLTPSAVTAAAQLMVQRGGVVPPGMARNKAAVTAIINRYAELTGSQSAQDIIRIGQDNKSQGLALQNFAYGSQGNTIRSLNVAVTHLAQLHDAVLALQNGDTPGFNHIAQWWERQTGSPLPGNAAAIKGIVSDEVNKAVIGGAGALADRKDLAGHLDVASSPAQLMGVIGEYTGAMGGQLGGLKQQYEQATGRKDFERFVSPLARRVLEGGGATASASLPAAGRSSAAPAPTRFARNPQTGQRLGLVNGQWVAVQ